MAKSIHEKEKEREALKAKRGGGDAPAFLYRYELLQRAKQDKGYRYGVRDLAGHTGLATGTVQQALEGKATKLETLYILAKWFGIPWIALFDIDRKLVVDRVVLERAKRTDDNPFARDKYADRYFIKTVDESITGDAEHVADLATPAKALGSQTKTRAGRGWGKSAGKGNK